MPDLLAWLLVLAGGLAALLLPWLMRPKARYPRCKSAQVQVLSKEPIGVTFHDHERFALVQRRFRMTKRCARCQETWAVELIEAR
ncbi:hypothetical protein [Truepera radiovictrix]|uniref:Uncharacterized protein n=1 Tax=Truepera radiovictrix (strain DSM 17093 / CIP 108686 / LMG 22925 / RQ-24) TaxID=649638 RepID=D7CW63_TRURR|nr:hypothetical protein [Truepera radiovictrix]ADI14326.1 hypothetical protein Trad_1203 [Truepera radiovictrix DSM 17093]WMT57116.1 hypothetical protein RCV51_13985 [Truepera radiovictrix]